MYKLLLCISSVPVARVEVESVLELSIQIQQEIPVQRWQEIVAEAEAVIAKFIEESTARHLADFKYENAIRAQKLGIRIPKRLQDLAIADLINMASQNILAQDVYNEPSFWRA